MYVVLRCSNVKHFAATVSKFVAKCFHFMSAKSTKILRFRHFEPPWQDYHVWHHIYYIFCPYIWPCAISVCLVLYPLEISCHTAYTTCRTIITCSAFRPTHHKNIHQINTEQTRQLWKDIVSDNVFHVKWNHRMTHLLCSSGWIRRQWKNAYDEYIYYIYIYSARMGSSSSTCILNKCKLKSNDVEMYIK